MWITFASLKLRHKLLIGVVQVKSITIGINLVDKVEGHLLSVALGERCFVICGESDLWADVAELEKFACLLPLYLIVVIELGVGKLRYRVENLLKLDHFTQSFLSDQSVADSLHNDVNSSQYSIRRKHFLAFLIRSESWANSRRPQKFLILVLALEE